MIYGIVHKTSILHNLYYNYLSFYNYFSIYFQLNINITELYVTKMSVYKDDVVKSKVDVNGKNQQWENLSMNQCNQKTDRIK